MKHILVTGAVGQIGSELTIELRRRYGNSNVIAGGNKTEPFAELRDSGPFETVDCLDTNAIKDVIVKYEIDTIFHLAAILSAVAESHPNLAWEVNVVGLRNVLELARAYRCAVFTPSSIGAFGLNIPLDRTPQDTIQQPTTIYGITKVTGELLCDYYFRKYQVDTRGVRYPGIISNVTLPGGGTTDYAVEIYYEAVKNRHYTCNLKAGTFLEMMYMPDAVKAAIELMEADPERLKHRNAFNVAAMSVDPETIAAEIRTVIPDFELKYQIDLEKQAIADQWPNSLDDSVARLEWDWSPDYDLKTMTMDMLEKLTAKLKA